MNDQSINAIHQLEMLAKHTRLSTLMADHHLLHFPSSNDLKLRGRAQHETPNKALLKILKIRRIVRAFVSKHAGRAAMALGGARAMFLDFLNRKQAAGVETRRIQRKQRGKNKDPPCTCGCLEVHLNLLPPSWSSSSLSWPSKATAVREPLEPGLLHCSYYDPSWNTEIPPDELQLPPVAGYLERPDEEYGIMEDDDGGEEDGGDYHEIDSLAERFIARCHERFMLEKQESYRRYREMLARTMRLTELT